MQKSRHVFTCKNVIFLRTYPERFFKFQNLSASLFIYTHVILRWWKSNIILMLFNIFLYTVEILQIFCTSCLHLQTIRKYIKIINSLMVNNVFMQHHVSQLVDIFNAATMRKWFQRFARYFSPHLEILQFCETKNYLYKSI